MQNHNDLTQFFQKAFPDDTPDTIPSGTVSYIHTNTASDLLEVNKLGSKYFTPEEAQTMLAYIWDERSYLSSDLYRILDFCEKKWFSITQWKLQMTDEYLLTNQQLLDMLPMQILDIPELIDKILFRYNICKLVDSRLPMDHYQCDVYGMTDDGAHDLQEEWRNRQKLFEKYWTFRYGNAELTDLLLIHKDKKIGEDVICEGITLQKEVDYKNYSEIFIDSPSPQTTQISSFLGDIWMGHKYETHEGLQHINHDIKKIMAEYGLYFETAFAIYQIRMLKAYEARYSWAMEESEQMKMFLQANPYTNNFTKDQLIGLRMYQKEYAHPINAHRRNDMPQNITIIKNANIKKLIESDLISAIQQNTLAQNTMLYRMVYDKTQGAPGSTSTIAFITDKNIGDTFDDLWYTSTSFDPRFPLMEVKDRKRYAIFLKIKAPKWTHYALIDQHFHGVNGAWQDEVLIWPHNTFLIKNKSEEDGTPVYELELISSGPE